MRTARSSAFTLVELMIAMAILSLLVVLLSSLVSGVSRAWASGEQQVQSFQDGRAIIDLLSRDLAQASISSKLQLIQNPILPPGVVQRVNSDALFWQAPLTSTTSGNLCEVGYYLTDTYELKRFFVPPDHPSYAIFTDPPTATSAPWLLTPFTAGGFDTASTTIAHGVLALWIRCLDVNGDAIPWFSARSPEAPPGSAIRYNSAARYQKSVAGTPIPPDLQWPYTATTTAQAHRLPSSLEVTVVTLDQKTFQRRPTIPPIPGSSDAADVPAAVDTFNRALIASRVPSARTFSARIALPNGAQ